MHSSWLSADGWAYWWQLKQNICQILDSNQINETVLQKGPSSDDPLSNVIDMEHAIQGRIPRLTAAERSETWGQTWRTSGRITQASDLQSDDRILARRWKCIYIRQVGESVSKVNCKQNPNDLNSKSLERTSRPKRKGQQMEHTGRWRSMPGTARQTQTVATRANDDEERRVRG